jgi:acyl-CoA-binding protein
LIPFKLIGNKEETTVNYADIESVKSTFLAATVSPGLRCFTLFMKDGTKMNFGLQKIMKDEMKQVWGVMKAEAAKDEAQKHAGFFGDAKKWEKWEGLRRKANQELAGSGPGPRRDHIVALINQALEAAK